MIFREQIWCVLSEEMSFETFTPIWSHVSENEKKIAKIQNLKFYISLNNFGRDPPQGYAWFFGPMEQNVNKNEKKKVKIKNVKFWKQTNKTWSGDMVDRYLSPKFGVNPLDSFWENVYGRTTDGRTDGRPRHDSSSAVQ